METVSIVNALDVMNVIKNLGFANSKFILGGSLALQQYGLLNRDPTDVDMIVRVSPAAAKQRDKLLKRLGAIADISGAELGYGSTLSCGIYMKLHIRGISACVWFTTEGYDDVTLTIPGTYLYVNTLKDIIKQKRAIMAHYNETDYFEGFWKHADDIAYIKNVLNGK